VIGPQRYLANVYIPRANAVDDPSTVVRLLRAARVGHLITHDTGTGGFDATVLPFLVDDELSLLRAHLARANPHWRHLHGRQALFVVPVTNAYVSPTWYPAKQDDGRVVPTWNYEVVHLHGTVVVHDDPRVVENIVRELTERHEGERSVDDGEPAWSVDDAPREFIERQLRAIVGIEMAVERVEAKRKLSQNRSTDDQAGVIAGLSQSSRAGDDAVSVSMRTD